MDENYWLFLNDYPKISKNDYEHEGKLAGVFIVLGSFFLYVCCF